MPKTTERQSFKKNLNEAQVNELENFFNNVSPMPKRKVKLELARNLGIKEELLNRWFQFKRNKIKQIAKANAPEPIIPKIIRLQRPPPPRPLSPPHLKVPAPKVSIKQNEEKKINQLPITQNKDDDKLKQFLDEIDDIFG